MDKPQTINWLSVHIAELTKDSEAVVESDDHGVGISGEDAAVVKVARPPREALAVHEYHNWIGGSLSLIWNRFSAEIKVLFTQLICCLEFS